MKQSKAEMKQLGGKLKMKESKMTIGDKFLQRVLTEKKEVDVDGVKDIFDISTLPADHPAVSSLMAPFSKKVVQMYHLLGVSPESLQLGVRAVKAGAMEMADRIRKDPSLRRAFNRLFDTLAAAKGFTRAAVTEADEMRFNAPMGDDKLMLIGTQNMRKIEKLLSAIMLPDNVLTRSMKRDMDSIRDVGMMIQKGAIRARFEALASQLGVSMDANASPKMESQLAEVSAAKVDAAGRVNVGANMDSNVLEELLRILGLNSLISTVDAMHEKMQGGYKFPNQQVALKVRTLVNSLKSREDNQ